jgi:DNA replication protein DnaC
VERLEIAEHFHKPTQIPQTMPISEEELEAFEAGWEAVPYRPLFNCPQCKGYGFLYPRKPDGSADYRKVVPCTHPGCYADGAKAYKRGEIVRQSGVIGLRQTFDTFNKDVPGVKKAYSAAWKIAEGGADFIWLIIYGGVGNGKTHLLKAITNRVAERGIEVRLIMMADLLSELRMAINTNQTDCRMKQLKETPYLLIDELGLEYGTDWEKEKIEELLASRWANGRFTVVATNRDIEELPGRIKSRFKDRYLSRWVKNEASDYRATRGK